MDGTDFFRFPEKRFSFYFPRILLGIHKLRSSAKWNAIQFQMIHRTVSPYTIYAQCQAPNWTTWLNKRMTTADDIFLIFYVFRVACSVIPFHSRAFDLLQIVSGHLKSKFRFCISIFACALCLLRTFEFSPVENKFGIFVPLRSDIPSPPVSISREIHRKEQIWAISCCLTLDSIRFTIPISKLYARLSTLDSMPPDIFSFPYK